MTIPNLIANYQKTQTVTKLKKAYSVLNQAYRTSFDEVGEATSEEAMEMGVQAYFDKYWAPYIKSSICKSYSECGYDKNAPFYKGNGEASNVGLVDGSTRTVFYTPDGFLYSVIHGTGAPPYTPTSLILLDINGGNGPNKYGKDVFVLVRVKEKGVLPLGYDRAEVTCGQVEWYSNYCAELIRRSGWSIPDGYPW